MTRSFNFRKFHVHLYSYKNIGKHGKHGKHGKL